MAYFKQGGLHFLRIGRYQFSACRTNPQRKLARQLSHLRAMWAAEFADSLRDTASRQWQASASFDTFDGTI